MLYSALPIGRISNVLLPCRRQIALVGVIVARVTHDAVSNAETRSVQTDSATCRIGHKGKSTSIMEVLVNGALVAIHQAQRHPQNFAVFQDAVDVVVVIIFVAVGLVMLFAPFTGC